MSIKRVVRKWGLVGVNIQTWRTHVSEMNQEIWNEESPQGDVFTILLYFFSQD